MANAPFAQFPGDFESLARQYWNTWNELLGRGGMTDAFGLGGGLGAGLGGLGSLPPGLGGMGMGTGTYDWYQRMQRLAADFSGGGSATDVARAWREMLGGQGADPFAGMLRSMHGNLAGGEWLEQVRPMLDMLLRPLRQQGAEWLQRPAFGPAREHQERLQALALAWQEWEQRNEAFNAVLAQATQGACERFERLLGEHDAPGKRLESARALFDLWIDAAEEAWAEIALSDEYRHAYAGMTNALMRLRLGLQREVEQFGSMLGMPGRGEIDALHRKVADLERALHAARRGAPAHAVQRPAPAAPGARPATVAPAPATDVAGADVQPAARKKTAAAARKRARTKAPGTPKSTPVRTVKQAAGARPAAPAARRKAPRRATRAAAATAAVKQAAAKPSSTKSAGKVAAPKSQSIAPRPAAGHAAKTVRSPRRAAGVKPKVGTRTLAAATPVTTASGKAAAVRAKGVPAKSVATAQVARKPTQGTTAKTALAATRKARATGGSGVQATSRSVEVAPATAKVVSMKDWVSRNMAAAAPDATDATGRKPGGKRGGRGR